jgi:hypothetical protein
MVFHFYIVSIVVSLFADPDPGADLIHEAGAKLKEEAK